VVRLNTRRRLCPASENVMRGVNPQADEGIFCQGTQQVDPEKATKHETAPAAP